jgi:2,3-bisphosphoglycerate-independent phosphoglycerate mutase
MTGSGGILVRGNLDELIKNNYAKGLNEEFLVPLKVQPDCGIKDGDALFFFNYREDSIRQIAMSFIDKEFEHFPRKEMPNLHIATMSHYMDKFQVPVAYPPEDIKSPLGKVLSDAGLVQLRLAESYKYAHVTYFFNGYIETPFTGEYRVLVPSEPIPHPDEHPQMMASAITDRLVQAMENRAFDFILVNYANGDTIAHSGNYHAALDAVKVIDAEIGRVIQVALNTDAIVMITSDHGNMEELINPATGRMETQHDPSPVPFYLMSKEFKGRKFVNWRTVANEPIGIISDVAPTVLKIMGIEKPEDMNGRDLLRDLI